VELVFDASGEIACGRVVPGWRLDEMSRATSEERSIKGNEEMHDRHPHSRCLRRFRVL